jgi:hypothetical protein
VSYRFEWIAGPIFLGAVLVLLIVPPFALIALAVVALAVVAALAAALMAIPYLLVRSLRRRRAERHRATDEGPVPMASAVARTDRAAPQSGVAALTNTTTARRST